MEKMFEQNIEQTAAACREGQREQLVPGLAQHQEDRNRAGCRRDESDRAEESDHPRDPGKRGRSVRVKPSGRVRIEQPRSRLSRHIFSDVSKPPARGENDQQPHREMQSEKTFRRKTRLEKMDLPCEATGDWLA